MSSLARRLFTIPSSSPGPPYAYTRLPPNDVNDESSHDNNHNHNSMAAGPAEVSETAHPDDDGGGAVVDAAFAKRVLRKIDMRLIPLLFVTYALNFMDKTILSSAAVFGLRDDTVRSLPRPGQPRVSLTDNGCHAVQHLVGQQYSWVSSVFYFGYLFWTYPTNLLIARLPSVAHYLSANALFWGAVVAATAACTNFAGLMTVRFLLGVAEATITPAFMFLTSSWYTRDEIPVRTGLWFAGNSIGGLVASLFAFGVGHIPADDNKVGPWRWMYIILGVATFVWGLVLFLFLPSNTLSHARFLTPAERRFAETRVVVAGTGRTSAAPWRTAQAIECLVDPKTWFLVGLELLTQIPNGGTQSFANLVITGSFGFTNLQSTLVNIPYSLLSGATIAATGYLAGRFRQANCLLIGLVVLPPVTGAALIYARAHTARAVSLVGYFCLAPGPAAMPLALSLVQANYRGVTKKLTVTALLFVTYCAGNIAGPHVFKTSEAPTYHTAFQTIMVCYALVIVLAAGLRTYLGWENARRARVEGFVGSAGAAGAVGESGKVVDVATAGADAVGEVELRQEDYEDVTDWQIRGFRYRL